MENEFFNELDNELLEDKRIKSNNRITQKKYNNNGDNYIDAVIVSALLPIYGLLIYAIHLVNNRYLAKRCLKASIIATCVYIVLAVIIVCIVMNNMSSYY